MKLFFNIVNGCLCIAVVRSLTCLQCSGFSGTCNFNDETCTAGTTSCQTVSSTSIIEGITTRRISQQCFTASNDFSLNSGVVSISQSNSFCESDRCNNQIVSEPANTTVNGLQCFGCYNSSSESCINSLRKVNCVGAENRCFNATGIQEALVKVGLHLTTRGCVSENICRPIRLLDFSIILNEVTCCQGDLCNGDASTTTGPWTSTTASTSISIAKTIATSTAIESSTSTLIATSKSTPIANTSTPIGTTTSTPMATSTSRPIATSTPTPISNNTTPTTTSTSTSSVTRKWTTETNNTSNPASTKIPITVPNHKITAANTIKSTQGNDSGILRTGPWTSTTAATSTSITKTIATSTAIESSMSTLIVTSKSTPIANTSTPIGTTTSTPMATRTSRPIATSTPTPISNNTTPTTTSTSTSSVTRKWTTETNNTSNPASTKIPITVPNHKITASNTIKSTQGNYSGIHRTEPVSNVSVLTNNSKPMENMDTVFLTCHASGFILSRIWYKDDRVIKDNDRIITSPDNVTLTIISVNRYDSGTYKCKASNDFSNKSGDTKLQVNYGPEDINITPPGPVQIEQGETLTLSCAASSVPPATYEWYNGSRLLKTEQTYNIESMNLNAGGSYTCRASNSITDKSTNTTIQITVQDPSDVIGGNSAGTYENISNNQTEETTKPSDESPTYMDLQLQDRSVYSELMR
ncbi:carcinoembryonic antigen-related cell adhesion molecule 5-like isoform X2 [Scyliorhinus canicula]|uniref:carcinoembryonic antigen-related cell adhesion molecule 5-like isoform X2 n=1 Tax=Scyliorhinus canicula TaxID=7830 RepID=UPI0018F46096|nr:carcinoembryonic antigen-related cell adhesion molecule 5-like isoform X2 [Scyliorhinus canicula]